MPRKGKKTTSKPKKTASKRRKTTSAPQAPPNGVVDIAEKRGEKVADELVSLAKRITRHLDDAAAQIVGGYHHWEEENPDVALKPRHKLAMVRLGFIGTAGFSRCHEPERLPEAAFLKGGHVDRRIERDYGASQVLMCPAMEAGLCQGPWRAMKTPPCYLLLLEVYDGLGGGALDDTVQEVIDDFGKWSGPEEYAASFERGARAVAQHNDHGSS